MTYFGWIPNLRGRLSFSTIGTSTKPYPFKKSIEANFKLITHGRMLNDSALPRQLRLIIFTMKYSPFRVILKALFVLFTYLKKNKESGNFFCNLYGVKHLILLFNRLFANKTLEKLIYLSGDFEFIYLEPLTHHDEDITKGNVYIISKLDKTLPIIMASLKNKNVTYQLANEALGKLSVLSSSFILPRNGLLTIDNINLKEVSETDLRWSTRSQGVTYDNFKMNAVSQIYYFLKDLCHQHQHHDSKSDKLLPLIKATPTDYLPKLANEVLKSLYRTILKMRRTHSEKDYYAMQGIMVYTKSFKKIVKKENPQLSGISDYCCDGDENISQSIQIKTNTLLSSRERKNKIISLIPSIGSLSVAIMGILFAFSSVIILSFANTDTKVLKKLKGEVPEDYISTVITILTNPWDILAITFTIFTFLFFLLSDYFHESKIRLDIFRLCYGIKYQYIWGIFLGLSACAMIYYSAVILDLTLITSKLATIKTYLITAMIDCVHTFSGSVIEWLSSFT
jgi:hypothetical protein